MVYDIETLISCGWSLDKVRVSITAYSNKSDEQKKAAAQNNLLLPV